LSANVHQKSLEDIFSVAIETAGNLTGGKNAPDRQTYPRRAKSSQRVLGPQDADRPRSKTVPALSGGIRHCQSGFSCTEPC
jgi:hypothetical protein